MKDNFFKDYELGTLCSGDTGLPATEEDVWVEKVIICPRCGKKTLGGAFVCQNLIGEEKCKYEQFFEN